MRTTYILSDFENLQPANFDLLQGHDEVRLIVFVGANQASISFKIVSAIQSLGDNATYTKISGNGRNALDFHIAFYLGELAKTDPHAVFHVISRDTGYDPLIEHLRQREISAHRHASISKLPFLRRKVAAALGDKIDAILANLTTRGASRPKTVKALKNTVNAQFQKSLTYNDLDEIIAELRRRKHITITDQTVSYGPAITGPQSNAPGARLALVAGHAPTA